MFEHAHHHHGFRPGGAFFAADDTTPGDADPARPPFDPPAPARARGDRGEERGDPPRRGRRGFGPPFADLEGFGPFGGPFGGRGRGRGRGGRAQRGDVRAAVLALLAERPMHGYEIITELAERTHGMWRPSAGSVYPTLQLLEDEGLITGHEADGKRRFTLTDAARADVEARNDPAPWDRVTGEAGSDAVAARESLQKLVMAWKQVVSTGTDEQQRSATVVMNDARRRLYAILAEE